MGRVIENFATDVRLTLLATAEETGGEPLKGRPAAAPPAGGLVLHQTAGVLQLARNRPRVRAAVRATDLVLPVKVGTEVLAYLPHRWSPFTSRIFPLKYIMPAS